MATRVGPSFTRFIVLDQWRWDFTGLDEAKVHMPTVKQLASEGLA